MPYLVYYDDNGTVYHIQKLNSGLFFVPEGEKIVRISLTNPKEPLAITESYENHSKEMMASLAGHTEETKPVEENDAAN